MAEYPKELEIDRLMNVAKTFGWEKAKEEVIGQEIHITLKKNTYERRGSVRDCGSVLM